LKKMLGELSAKQNMGVVKTNAACAGEKILVV
jgi:hypothetical protein